MVLWIPALAAMMDRDLSLLPFCSHPVAFYICLRGFGVSPVEVVVDRIGDFALNAHNDLEPCGLKDLKRFRAAASRENHIRFVNQDILG